MGRSRSQDSQGSIRDPRPIDLTRRMMIILVVLLVVHGCAASGKQPPQASAGVLEVAGWDFTADGPVELNGEWALYWQRLLSGAESGEARPDGYLKLPETWKDHRLADGRRLPAFGYATFRLQLKGLDEKKRYMVDVPSMFTAYRLYFKDSRTGAIRLLAQAGQIGTSRSGYRPHLASGYATLPMVTGGELVLQIANFHRADRPGTWAPMQLGTEQQIHALIFKNRQRDFLIIGAALIIGLYSQIIFFLRREERASLWLGLLCLCLAGWFMLAGDYLTEYVPIGYVVNERLNYLIPYALILTFYLFEAALIPRFFDRLITRIVVLTGLVQCLIVLVTPTAVFSGIMQYSIYYFAFPVVLVGYGLTRTLLVQRDAVPLLNLSGALILTLCGLKYTIDLRFGYIPTSQYAVQLGLFALILCNASAIAVQNARARRQAEALSLRLREEMQALNASEEERRALEHQIQQARKMEAIGVLAGGIAHDFNNILASMMVFAEMTRDGLPEGDLKENQVGILTGCARARDLVKQILTFSRRGAIEKRPLHVEVLVKEALKLMRAALPANIVIDQRVEPGGGSILANATHIHQIVMNLCANAGYAMQEKGGTLGVEVASTSLAESNPQTLPPGRYVRVRVTDTGHGMAPELIERIFDPFFTTKETGHGMGLPVVYGIVRDHGGMIQVESTPGQGSAFTVHLPCVEGDTMPMVTEDPVPGGTERILVIDDEPQILIALERMLESLGYQVNVCAHPEKALELFRDDPHGFDLILTDMTMPDLHGMELARRALAVRPEIPVVLCTGFSELVTEEDARRLGIRAFLAKPIEAHVLAHTLRQTLDGADVIPGEPLAPPS